MSLFDNTPLREAQVDASTFCHCSHRKGGHVGGKGCVFCSCVLFAPADEAPVSHRFSDCNQEPVGAPYAKGSDTSKAAAKRVSKKVENDRAEVLLFIMRQGDHGAIWDETWEPCGLTPTSNGRITELRDMGLIFDSGRRRKTRTGSSAVVWVATKKAIAAAADENLSALPTPQLPSAPIQEGAHLPVPPPPAAGGDR